MLNLSEIFSASWKLVKPHLVILAGLMFGYMVISVLLSFALVPLAGDALLGSLLVHILSLAIGIVFSLGYIKNVFQALDGMEPQFSAYMVKLSQAGNYLLAGIIMGLLVGIGIILLIIPGIYIAMRLQFAMAYIIEEDADAIDALTRSWNLTKGHCLNLFLLFLIMIGLSILGMLLLFVGFFVTVPLIYMMYCYAFRKLVEIQNEQPAIEM